MHDMERDAEHSLMNDLRHWKWTFVEHTVRMAGMYEGWAPQHTQLEDLSSVDGAHETPRDKGRESP